MHFVQDFLKLTPRTHFILYNQKNFNVPVSKKCRGRLREVTRCNRIIDIR